MSHQSTAWRMPSAASSPRTATRSSADPVPPTWITYSLLVLASGVLFTLAGACAWLSYHAQVAYVFAHNGGLKSEAKVWALLLDTGTGGVSLLRLHETLRCRTGAATRISLFGCITASVVLNLLHSPSRSPGGYLVAAVPSVMYAVFLEHLLTNLRNLLAVGDVRRSWWHALALWVNFPALMWSGRRISLRRDAEAVLSAPELDLYADDIASCGTSAEEEVEQVENLTAELESCSPPRSYRRGRGLGPKRVAFEAALTDQVRSGDLRLFSGDKRERNAAAYQAAASLPAPLSRGAARRYVVQALPRLEETSAAVKSMPAESVLGTS